MVVGVTVTFAALFRVVLFTVLVVLWVGPGAADAVRVLVTVTVRVGSELVLFSVVVVTGFVAALVVVAAHTGLPASAPPATPATSAAAAQTAELRRTVLTTRGRAV